MVRTYTHRRNGREYAGTVEVRAEGGYWSVYVNGQRLVDRESFAIADRIADGIVTPGTHWPRESDEVSSSILDWLARNAA
jgi:hypothetical protein